MLIGCGVRRDANPDSLRVSGIEPSQLFRLRDSPTISAVRRHTGESRYPQGPGESVSPGLNTDESSKTLATKSSDLLY